MSELTQTLKILVTRYPGTMAELARKASIDRSTLCLLYTSDAADD